MNKLILTGSVLLASIVVNAQDLPSTPSAPSLPTATEAPKSGDMVTSLKKTAEERATALTGQVKAACGDLTADQEAKVKAIFLSRAQKVDEIKATNSSKEDRKDALKPLFAQSREELKNVLTAAQFEKMKVAFKEKREEMKSIKGKVRGKK